MTLYEFIALDEGEQAETAWQGQFCGVRYEDDFVVLLYRIHQFFVEVFYEQKTNHIERIRPFSTRRLLEPYLNLNLN